MESFLHLQVPHSKKRVLKPKMNGGKDDMDDDPEDRTSY